MFNSRNISKALYPNFIQLKKISLALKRSLKQNRNLIGMADADYIEAHLGIYDNFVTHGEEIIDSYNEGVLSTQDLEFLDDSSFQLVPRVHALQDSIRCSME